MTDPICCVFKTITGSGFLPKARRYYNLLTIKEIDVEVCKEKRLMYRFANKKPTPCIVTTIRYGLYY